MYLQDGRQAGDEHLPDVKELVKRDGERHVEHHRVLGSHLHALLPAVHLDRHLVLVLVPVVGGVGVAVVQGGRLVERVDAHHAGRPQEAAVGQRLHVERHDDGLAGVGVRPPQAEHARRRAREANVDLLPRGHVRPERRQPLLARVRKAPAVVHGHRRDIHAARHVEKYGREVAVLRVGVARLEHKVLRVAKDAGGGHRVGLERGVQLPQVAVGHALVSLGGWAPLAGPWRQGRGLLVGEGAARGVRAQRG
mmetsp:Transcript_21046/g.53505  ORF Transcript_21046/g.53505 Transcript_21046/m.53505 type:complete len:251 (-) Transcript_21046:1016-1768(-)